MPRLYMSGMTGRKDGFRLAPDGDIVNQRTRPQAHAEEITPGDEDGQQSVAQSQRTKRIGDVPDDGRQKSAADNAGAQEAGQSAVVPLHGIKGEGKNNGTTDGTPEAEHREGKQGNGGTRREQGQQEGQRATGGEHPQYRAGIQ